MYFENLGNVQLFGTLKYLKGARGINGDLHRAFKSTSDFDAEVSIITKKYLDAGYPVGFIKSVIGDFKKKDENQPIISDWLSEKRSKVLSKLPHCPSNEHDVKRFIDRIKSFTGGKIMLIVLRSTRNIKDKVAH